MPAASPFLCGMADQPKLEADQQQDEQTNGQGNTYGQCLRRSLALTFILEHIEQCRKKAGEYHDQHEDDDGFGQHGISPARMCWDYAARVVTMQSKRYVFRPQLIPTIAALLLIVLMVKLGFWQYDKAEQKTSLQAAFDARLGEAPVALPESVSNIEDWRYRRIQAKGRYEPQYQIVLDNQVENEVAGYHVITPFRAEGSKVLLLVDRGWIEMGDRSRLPQIETPADLVDVSGFIWVPSGKFYELSAPPSSKDWQPLWQNMDMTRYAKAVPFDVLPFVLRLDAASPSGGFVRNWPKPAERIETHIGYAWQWWGFSVVLAAIWLFVNVRRDES